MHVDRSPSVVVAGGGPVGLMLAAELMLAGTDVVVVERRTSQALESSRAGGLHPRTLEVLDQRGVADRFVSAGEPHPGVGFAHIPLGISDFPSRHNYVLALWQRDFERILAEWVAQIGVAILRGREVESFEQDETGVDVHIGGDGPTTLRAEYLVGCDGGRSLVRRAAGIDFVGTDASTSWMIAEVEMGEEPEFGFRHDDAGTHAIGRRQPDEPIRLALTEREVDHRDPTVDELRATLIGVYGTDFDLQRVDWVSRFTDMTRQAVAYRDRRVLLAGDAAHVHPPHGGQGLNLGVQDAVNLGWKLAQVVSGVSPDSLLDTYHAERQPVGARVLRNTLAQVALGLPDDRHRALLDTMTELLALDEPRRHIAGMISALDLHYDLGGGHALVGRRMPDLDLVTAEGPRRVFDLLHDARPILVAFDAGDGLDGVPWADRVRTVHATCDGRWELPVVGEVDPPEAVLVRPDGYVAWAGEVGDPDLSRARATWFGSSSPTHSRA